MLPESQKSSNYFPSNFPLKSDYTQTPLEQPNYFQFLQDSVKNSSSTNIKTVKRSSTLHTDHFSINQDDSDSKNVYTYTTRTTLANPNSNLSFNTLQNFYTNSKGPSVIPQQIKTDYKCTKNDDNRVNINTQTHILKKSEATSGIDELNDQKFEERPQFVYCEEEGEVIIQSRQNGKVGGIQQWKKPQRIINQNKQGNKNGPKYNLFSFLDQCGNNGCHRESIKSYEICPAKISKNNPWI